MRKDNLSGLLYCTAPTGNRIQYYVTGSAPCMRIMFGQVKERNGIDVFVASIFLYDIAYKRRDPGNIFKSMFSLAL